MRRNLTSRRSTPARVRSRRSVGSMKKSEVWLPETGIGRGQEQLGQTLVGELDRAVIADDGDADRAGFQHVRADLCSLALSSSARRLRSPPGLSETRSRWTASETSKICTRQKRPFAGIQRLDNRLVLDRAAALSARIAVKKRKQRRIERTRQDRRLTLLQRGGRRPVDAHQAGSGNSSANVEPSAVSAGIALASAIQLFQNTTRA